MKTINMAEAQNSNFAVFSMIMTIIGMALLGFSYVVLNPLTPLFNEMFNETYQSRYNETLPFSNWITLLSVTSSAIIIGAVIGAISVGKMLMLLSRKQVLQFCHVISLVGIVVVALIGKMTSSYEVIIIGRILSGISMGVTYVVIPVIIAEICARERQSLWQCISATSTGLGVLLGVVFTHPQILGTKQLWPIAVVLPGIFNLFYLLASHKIPNTLFYVARQGDKDKTMALLKKMRTNNKAELEQEYDSMLGEMKGAKMIGLTEIFKTKQYRMQFFNVFCLFANIQLCGAGCIILYSDRIFKKAGIKSDQATNVTVGLFASQFCISMCGPNLVERLGGRLVLLISSAMQILALILFTISQATIDLAPEEMPYVSVTAMAIFLLFLSSGTNIATTAMAAAVTIEPTRATIMGFTIVFFWILAWFTVFILPFLEISLGAYAFTIWIGCATALFIYFIIFLPETKGKSVDEIQARLLRKKSSSTGTYIDMQAQSRTESTA